QIQVKQRSTPIALPSASKATRKRRSIRQQADYTKPFVGVGPVPQKAFCLSTGPWITVEDIPRTAIRKRQSLVEQLVNPCVGNELSNINPFRDPPSKRISSQYPLPQH